LISEEIALYFQHCRSLQFEEKPDYKYLKGLFESIWKTSGFIKEESILDWEEINSEENGELIENSLKNSFISRKKTHKVCSN
jgi:hypothetical protein